MLLMLLLDKNEMRLPAFFSQCTKVESNKAVSFFLFTECRDIVPWRTAHGHNSTRHVFATPLKTILRGDVRITFVLLFYTHTILFTLSTTDGVKLCKISFHIIKTLQEAPSVRKLKFYSYTGMCESSHLNIDSIIYFCSLIVMTSILSFGYIVYRPMTCLLSNSVSCQLDLLSFLVCLSQVFDEKEWLEMYETMPNKDRKRNTTKRQSRRRRI